MVQETAEETSRSIPWGFLLRILGVVFGFVLVFLIVDTDKLWTHVLQISWGIMIFALVLNFGRFVLVAIRWRLMNTESSDHSIGQYILFTLVSAPAQLFLPGILGMDLARGVLIGQSAEENRTKHLVSVLSDRIIGLFSVILLGMGCALAAPSFPSREKYVAFLGLLMLCFVGGVLVAASSWLHKLLQKLFAKFGAIGEKVNLLLEVWQQIAAFYKANFSRVIWALLVCFLIHFSWFYIVYLLANNLGLKLSFFVVTTVTAISWVVIALPISWMGLGVNELSFIYLLSFQQVATEKATALSLHQAAINIAFAVICIPLWIFVTNKAKAQAKAAAAVAVSESADIVDVIEENEAAKEDEARG